MSPSSPDPNKKQVNVRLEDELYEKLEQIRYENSLPDMSSALKYLVMESETHHLYKYKSPGIPNKRKPKTRTQNRRHDAD